MALSYLPIIGIGNSVIITSSKLNVCEILGCLTENDISYYGNDVNNGTLNVQSDVASCRSSCKSMGADYFGFNYGINQQCWCKNSNAGRMQKNGIVSGETSCPGEDSFVVYQIQGCIKSATGLLGPTKPCFYSCLMGVVSDFPLTFFIQ